MKLSRVVLGLVGGVLLTPCAARAESVAGEAPGPSRVQIRRTNDCYQLYVNGAPFYIKGAGLEFGDPRKLALNGGNSFRTWRTENGRCSGRAVLNRAWSNGLYVTMGLEVARERHGFNYDDETAVAAQFDRIKAEVLRHKDHPALLMWCIGNELNLNSRNPRVWNAVNEISKMIHQADANHPTITALAGIGRDLIRETKLRAPDLDLVGIQMYADIVNLPRYLRESQWEGPYVVTEWGATGHWEVPKTSWGAPIENDSSVKADLYLRRFDSVIRADTRQCLGSYVFLWEQKQERTPTWYGMFLESGENTATVDVMHSIWKGVFPTNRSPVMSGIWLDGKVAVENVRLEPGRAYAARTVVADPDQDAMSYRWEVLRESAETKVGGDFEARPAAVQGSAQDESKPEIVLKAPLAPGTYRLFVYAYDGRGNAAHANIPFLVESGETLRRASQ
jgi:hypothetical protein